MKLFRAGIVGIGFIGVAHIEALRRLGNVSVVAIATVDRPEEYAKQLCIPAFYTNYQEMIDKENLDAIHICTPNYLHCDVAVYAMERGVHVLCEKPMTATLEQAIKMTEVAKKTGLVNGINYHNRFNPMVSQMHHMVTDGDIGEVLSVHGGYIQDWLLLQTDYSWRLIAKESGATRVIADIGSHWLDTVEYVTGMKVTDVLAEFSTWYKTRKKLVGGPALTFTKANPDGLYEDVPIDTEDIAMVLLRFENGAIGNIASSQMFAGKKNKLSVLVGGTKASLEWDTENGLNNLIVGHRDTHNQTITKDPGLVHPNTSSIVDYPGGHVEGFPDTFKQCFRQFYQQIEQPSASVEFATFADGLHGMQLIEAIRQSAETEQWIKIQNE